MKQFQYVHHITILLICSLGLSSLFSEELLICIAPGHHIEMEMADNCHCDPIGSSEDADHTNEDCVDIPLPGLLDTPTTLSPIQHLMVNPNHFAASTVTIDFDSLVSSIGKKNYDPTYPLSESVQSIKSTILLI